MNFDKSLDYILNLLHLDRPFVDSYINTTDQSVYFKETAVKKRGGSRLVYEPQGDKLQAAYKAIYEQLKAYRPLIHDSAHGFLKDRSNVTNAREHLGARFIATIDIEDFFDSITKDQVEKTLLRLGFNPEAAEVMSRFCTINGFLPQGVNCSPDISNHCFYELDVELSEYANKHGIRYTRYADDMTFSGPIRTDETKFSIADAIAIVEFSGSYKIAKHKTKIQRRGANQYVTGLTIFDDKMPRVSKKYKRRLRLELYLIKKLGIDQFIINSGIVEQRPLVGKESTEYRVWREKLNSLGTDRLSLIEGRINYINGVEPQLAAKMYSVLQEIYENRKSQQEAEKIVRVA